ncbi:MAG: hypothetical protein ACYSWO_29755 [Planctomycetota bacterium]|jgi:hypothetical protein
MDKTLESLIRDLLASADATGCSEDLIVVGTAEFDALADEFNSRHQEWLEGLASLQPGDEVYWDDPDNGTCSRTIVIADITVNGEIVSITGQDGSELECFASELS